MKIKTKQVTHCLSHECTKCGRKLHAKLFRSEVILLALFPIMAMIGIFAADYMNPGITDCYERHYLSGQGTSVETIKTVNIDCPK